MKKLYVTLLGLTLTVALNAQVVYNANNYPLNGSSVNYNVDTLGAAFSIQGGTNMNWDFSGLTTDYVVTVEYVDPAGTPFASNFPTATSVTKSGNFYVYNRKDNAGVFEIGQGLTDDMGNLSIRYNSEAKTYNFPLSYAATYDSQFRYNITVDPGQAGIDSLRISSGVTYNFVVDSWGSLTIPAGTFPVTRLIQTITSQDTVSVLTAVTGWQVLNTSTSNDIVLFYLNPAKSAPVLIANQNEDEEGNTFYTVQHFADGNVNIEEAEQLQTIQTFPNPAIDNVNIKIEQNIPLLTYIYDINGRLVEQQNMQSGNNVLDTSKLTSGLYTINIHDLSGRRIGTSKISIVR